MVIGGPESRYRGVRELIVDLTLMPVQGGARVAIIEGADRMNEDAQSALLKTLEEPSAGVVIILCADREALLLPTVRSRCARVRLGLVGSRDIEAIVADHDLADPPLAARLGRLAGGRPGLALAYARAPDAVLIRAELSRVLLDLTGAGAAARLAAARAALPRAMAMAAALTAGDEVQPGPRPARKRRNATPTTAAQATAPAAGAPAASALADDATEAPEEEAADEPGEGRRKVPTAERRRAVETLLALWMDLARDIALVETGGGRSVRDPVLLDELTAIAAAIEPGAATRFLERAARAAELLASNVSPELLLDTIALAWPRRRAAA